MKRRVDHQAVFETKAQQNPITRLIDLCLAFKVITIASIIFCCFLMVSNQGWTQELSQSPEKGQIGQIKSQTFGNQDLLLNPPNLYAPHEYEPKIIVVEEKADILGSLVKNKSKLKPLTVDIDIPNYIYGDIVIRWNSAMVSPVDVGLSPKFTASITPKIEGKWYWQGTQSIRFSPKTRWRYATQYKVKLKGPMKSLKGQKLGPYFESSRHFSTKRNEVRSISLYEDKSWSSFVGSSSLIQVCLDHKDQGSIPLSKIHLYKLQGRRILKSLALAHAPSDEIPKTYYGDQCRYFKIRDPIDPFSKYRVEIDKGLSSEEGSLLSDKPYWKDFNSETQLNLKSLSIYRHYIRFRFNHKVSTQLVYDHTLLYPVGLNPNELKAEEQQQHNLLRPKNYKRHNQGSNWSVELYHHSLPTKELAVWIRPKNIKRNRYNALKRKQVFSDFWKNKQDPGQEWVLLKVDRPDLGSLSYDFFPSLMSVEQLNQPAEDLSYYGLDHLCLRWHTLSPQQLAEYDVVEGIDEKLKKSLYLPTVGKELCAHVFDPNYVKKRQKLPLVPYRYALAGEMKDWSFVNSDSSSIHTDQKQQVKSSVNLVDPQATTPASQVFQDCTKPSNPCAITSAMSHNFYKWANQLPTLKSGSGPQFYLLRQKWHWLPKKDGLGQGYWHQGKSIAPNKQYYFQSTSMLQATRYGLISKLNEEGGQAWVWDLASRKAVDKAKLTVYAAGGSKIAESISDQTGLARFKFNLDQIQSLRKAAKKDRINYYIVANVNEDYAFVSSSREHRVYEGSGYYYYYYSDNDYKDTRGLVWSDRDIYRPGDDVFVAGNLAKVSLKGVEPLRQAKCLLTFHGRYDSEIDRKEFQSSALGGFAIKLKLDSYADLGTYKVKVSCKSNQDPKHVYSWQHEFRVADFKRPSFKVDAYAQNKILSKQVLSFKSKALYFYGAGLKGRRWSAFTKGSKDSYEPSNVLKYRRLEDPPGVVLGRAKLKEFTFGGLSTFELDYNDLESEVKSYFPNFNFNSKLELNGLDSQSGKLDDNGGAKIQFKPVIEGYAPYRISTQWTVSDSDQATLSAQSSVSVHPSQSYIGLRSLQGYYVPSDKENQVEVIMVDPLSDRFASPREVEVNLFQVQWVKIASKDEIGRDEVQNQQKLVKVGACRLKQVSTPQTCSLKPSQSGEYLWIARSFDSKGQETYSILNTYVYGSYGSWREVEGNDLKLRLTTKQPKIGEELGILIENPFPEAEVWITVERERVIYSKRQKIGPSDMVKIPITEKMGPNAWVKVALTQPRVALPYLKTMPNSQQSNQNANDPLNSDEKENSDLGQARELYGSEEIKVRLTSAELKLELSPDAKEKRPGDPLTVKIALRDVQGKPVSGEVYLWALDESVARLTDFKAPDIFTALHSDRQNQVKTYSHLRRLIAHATMGNKGYPVGGGGGEESPESIKSRSDFKATPFFLGVQKVGESGQARFTQKLSDDLTTFKLFALAVSERERGEQDQSSKGASSDQVAYLLRAGVGESKVTVNLPLMLKAVLPRSLTVGDRFNASAMVSSLLANDETLKVKFELTGPIEALGDTEIQTTVPAKANQVISAPYQALGLGKVKVQLTLYKNDKVEDRVERELEIQAPAAPESFAQVGELLARPLGQEETVVIDLRPSSQEPSSEELAAIKVPKLPAQVQLDFGVSVINNLFNDVIALLEYPYGCLEQRSSRVLPFALAKALGLPMEERFNTLDSTVPSDVRIAEIVQDYFETLAKMQSRSGGIRYWLNDRAGVNLWSNIYAFVVINELSKSGHENFDVNLKSLVRFLEKSRPYGFKLKNRREYNVKPEISAFLSFALSEYSDSNRGLEEDLYSIKDELNLNAKLLLAASMAGPIGRRSQGARLESAKSLFREAMGSFSFDGERLKLNESKGAWAWWSFDSNRRKLALALIAMLRVEPEHELALPLLKTLAQKTKGRQFLNTQASAFSLLAIRDYLSVRESVTPDMHVDVQMLTKKGKRRSKSTLSTHDIKGFDAPLISVKRELNLQDSVLSNSTQKELVTEGIGISASGQGRLYYGARITQYPQTVRQESLNRGYGLEREYRLKLPANASDAQRRKLFTNKKDELNPDLFPKTLSYQLGDLVEVTLTLKVPHEAYYLVINDALPSGLEIVDQSLKGAQFAGPSRDSDWHAFDHIELRDDRVLLFADKLRKGTYKFRYIAKASTVGRFIRPAAVVEEMYAPQHAGRSDGGYLWVNSIP